MCDVAEYIRVCVCVWGVYVCAHVWRKGSTSFVLINFYSSIIASHYCVSCCRTTKWTSYIRLPQWLSGKESACSAGDIKDTGSIPGSGRSPRGGHGIPLQYFCLENPKDRGTWWATVHGGHKDSDTTKEAASCLDFLPTEVITELWVEFWGCGVGCCSSSLLYTMSVYLCRSQSGGGTLPSFVALSCVC